MPTLPPTPTRAKPSLPKLIFARPKTDCGRRIMIYGSGGVGKTSLAAGMPGVTAFFDLDNSLGSLPNLREAIDAGKLLAVDGVTTWQGLIDTLSADGWDAVDNIVIDSATAAEELAIADTLMTHKINGAPAESVDDYGYGKGYGYVFETFTRLMPLLDRHRDAGRNVVLLAHDCQKSVANPEGLDFLRMEPRLQDPASGKASIRLRVREWCDDVFYLRFDTSVSSDKKGATTGKVTTAGTRSVYTLDRGWCMAKCRSTTDTLAVDNPTDFWNDGRIQIKTKGNN